MKRHRAMSITAALFALVALASTGTVSAASRPDPVSPAKPVSVAAPGVRLTVISVSCPSYSVVPANKTPTTFDQTGGHGGQLDPSYQTTMTNPATDIPKICSRADGWQFQFYGDPGLTTPVGTPFASGADGVGTGATTVVLDAAELALAAQPGAPTGLWISELMRPGVGAFAALRCFDDINNGDDAENIQSIGTLTQLFCIAFTVAPASTYTAITPVRLLDTREGNGLSGRIHANVPATFTVAGRGGIPSNAVAVTGNITAVAPSAGWAVFLGPNPVASPDSSTINFGPGDVAGNGLTVALSSSGTLSATYISTSGNTTDLVFDATGFFTPDATGATYHAMSPARVLDTRQAVGLATRLIANTPATFTVAGQNGIPADATAVTGNLTVVGETSAWAVFLGPVAEAAPTTSTLNFTAGQAKGNSLTVELGTGGSLSATYISNPGNTTDLVFDVTGFYTPDATGARFVPVSPIRLLDTRSGNGISGRLSANTPASFVAAGRLGVPATATAITGNLTVVNDTAAWAVFLGPVATASPTTSTLNFTAHAVVGNGLTVSIGAGGDLFATYMSTRGNTTDLVLDVTGYFQP